MTSQEELALCHRRWSTGERIRRGLLLLTLAEERPGDRELARIAAYIVENELGDLTEADLWLQWEDKQRGQEVLQGVRQGDVAEQTQTSEAH